MKLAIVGPSGVGKTHGALWLSQHTSLRYTFGTSHVILPHAAKALGMTETQAYACRHEHRKVWRRLGDELRRDDPAALARATLAEGDIVVGIRSRIEMEAVRSEGLCDLVVWIEREVPADPTLEFGAGLADAVIGNNGTLEAFHGRLRRLARACGLIA